MTKQVWVPQRATVDVLQQFVPASFNFFNALGTNPTSNASILIDLRPYIKGGRLPYRVESVNPLPNGLVLLKDRLILKGPRPLQGSFQLSLNVYDAYGSVVPVLSTVYLSYGPLTCSAAYPDYHNNQFYNYTPPIRGGQPPYFVSNVPAVHKYPGDNSNLSGLIFDPSNGNVSGLPRVTANSSGNIYGILITDSASPPNTLEVDSTISQFLI